MFGCENIIKLYNKVLDDDISEYNISNSAIRIGIKSMAEVYKPLKEKLDRSVVANFNDVAHRCAYLHKYASLHTTMVRDLMFSAIRQNYDFFNRLLFSESPFKMCSLGGGPGSDVVGVLASLMDTFNHRHDLEFSVTIIDYMEKWSKSFGSVIKELTSGSYGTFGRSAGQSLQWRYMGADLLQPLDPEVKREISSASLITTIKFISAANCKDTGFMVGNIFSAMKPGAIIIFIDNAAGGFKEFILEYALKFNFIPIFGPISRKDYSNDVLRVERFGFRSCSRTWITAAVLQKPYEITPRLRITLPASGYYREVYEDCSSDSTTEFATPIPDTPLVPNEVERGDQKCVGIPNTPLTPRVFQLHKDKEVSIPDPRSSALYSDNGHHPISHSDYTKRVRNGISSKNSCLPLSKIKHWRHHLSTKLDSFKSRIQNKRGKKKNDKNENDSE